MTVPAQVLAAVRSIPHPRQEPTMTALYPLEPHTEEQAAHLARIEGADPAEESFDPIAALRRVEALCDVADDQPDGYECRFITTDVIRAAIASPQTGEH